MGRTILTDVDPRSNLPRHRQHSHFLLPEADISSVPSFVALAESLLRAVGPCMAFLAPPVSPSHWGTTFGRFGAAAIAISYRGRANADLVGASNASPVLPRRPPFRRRGLHLSRGRHLHHRRRTWHANISTPSSCFQKVGDIAISRP